MRLEIWKHTLPGPRIIRYPFYLTEEICQLTNRALNPNFPNREARQVFNSFYKKLEVPRKSACKPKLFLFVDYEIDTVFAETRWIDKFERREKSGRDKLLKFLNNFSPVKHLAIGARFENWFDVWDTTVEEEQEWRDITTCCKSLQSLTYVSVNEDQPLEEWDYEWTLVNVEGEIKKSLSLETSEGIFSEDKDADRITPFVKGLSQIGNLNMLCIGASHIRTRLEALERTRIKQLIDANGQNKKNNTRNLQFNFAAMASRSQPKEPWMLEYYIMENGQNSEDGLNDHWHISPILLGDGTISSCTLVEQTPDSEPACGCGVERWQFDWEGNGTGDTDEDIEDEDDGSDGSDTEDDEDEYEEDAFDIHEDVEDEIEGAEGESWDHDENQ